MDTLTAVTSDLAGLASDEQELLQWRQIQAEARQSLANSIGR